MTLNNYYLRNHPSLKGWYAIYHPNGQIVAEMQGRADAKRELVKWKLGIRQAQMAQLAR